MSPSKSPRLDEDGLSALLLAAQLPVPFERRADLLRRFGPMLGLANRLSDRMRHEDVEPAHSHSPFWPGE